jgi:starch-binding outer membrane protein, SusD/RagB family
VLTFNIKKMKNIISIILVLFSASFVSCKKYLDKKPDKSLVVPSAVQDLQAVLDNKVFMNNGDASWDEASADNYYLTEDAYNTLLDFQKNAYRWQNSDYTYSSQSGTEWGHLYDAVYFCNLALENIENIDRNSDPDGWNNVKGSALFYRAQTFLHTVWLFAKTYDKSTAKGDYGIVLRTTSDFNVPSARANLEDSYQKIIADLELASDLLPAIPQNVTRPSKSSAYACLARTFLSMREYDSAYKYSNLSLHIKNDLMDYNDPNMVNINSSTRPFKQLNPEVVFQKIISVYYFSNIYPSIERVDTILFDSYNDNDLRKVVFFRPVTSGHYFKGTYNGDLSHLFTGIATDEVYLMRAECEARLNNKDAALNDLNTLMLTRWRTGFFIPFTALTPQEALTIILTERRKELLFRGLRWMDIKRLNKEGGNITLMRIINGTSYILPPNDNRYALPLPLDIVNSLIPQNKY